MNVLSNVTDHEPVTARAWVKILAPYRQPDDLRTVFEIAITILPFAAMWAAMAWSVGAGYWLGMVLVVPAAGFLVRLFMIQHDCGHGSVFSNRNVNDWAGRALGVLTFTPYSYWQHNHAMHHSGSGSLDHRGFGDITTLTVAEYNALSSWGKLKYRAYRNPLTLFGIGPAYVFLLEQRLPIGFMKRGWKYWISTQGTNLSMALIAAGLIWLVGWKTFLIVQIPVVVLAATIGVWLFYVQHQFEDTMWDRNPNWDRHEAALYGSSHYDLPPFLHWLTGNIGIHHVHHLCAGIPFFRLPDVLKHYPLLADVNRMTLMESFQYFRLSLWDEDQRRLVSFREVSA